MSAYTKLITEPFLDGQGLRIVLNAPKANILDGVMMGEISSVLDDVRERHGLKLLCFSGQGDHFSFGASVPDHVKDKAPAMIEAFHGIFLRLADLAIPTVATVRGNCLGGGMELALFCNWVIAHPNAIFAQPEIKLAVLPPIASLILPLKIGQSRADEVNLTGRNVTATEGKEIGLVDRIAEDPQTEVETWANQEIAPKSGSALRCAVRASRIHFNHVLRAELKAMEKLYLDELMETHDANEGLAAFMEKRSPKWTNQ